MIVAVFTLAFASFRSIGDGSFFDIPSNFPQPTYHFESNPISDEGVKLGKMLFYDSIISADNTVSCGSCHQQSSAFTQHGHALSHGVNDKLTKRNSMPLFNMAWSKSFGWDGGVHDLDLFAISPITNPVEMNESMGNVLEKLRKSPTYPGMFKRAFGTEEINTERFLKALSQFMLTMVSANSRYDRYVRYEGVELTAEELEGMELFKKNCSSCHSGELFTDYSFRNNGLEIASNKDLGRYEVNQTEADKYKFKVPSLRNLSFTAPYMHDGRLNTLDDVLEHYSSKIKDNPYLDPLLKTKGQLGIALNKSEQKKIIAFLKTLDDEDFIKQEKFSESSLEVFTPAKQLDDEVKNLHVSSEDQADILNKITEDYLKIKDAIFEKNTKVAARYAEKMISKLNELNEKEFEIGARVFLNENKEKMTFNAVHIIEGKGNWEHQFDHFSELSKYIFVTMGSFRNFPKKLFLYENKSQKALWVSENEKPEFYNATSQLISQILPK